jgi:uridine kinase
MSCSGKSTVACTLAQQLEYPVLHADNYFKRGANRSSFMHNGILMQNFEEPRLYDYDALYRESKSHTNIIMEGLHLFTHQDLLDSLDYRFYLCIPSHISIRRRLQREEVRKSDESYALFGVYEWIQHGLFQKRLPQVMCIDASGKNTQTLEAIMQVLKV